MSGKFHVGLLALVLGLLGCNGNAGMQGAQQVTVTQPGTIQSFNVEVFNGTQFPVYVFINANGGGMSASIPTTPGTAVLVYPGTSVQLDIGFLPQFVQVDVVMQTTPLYQFPSRVFLIGRDFNYWNNSIGTSY